MAATLTVVAPPTYRDTDVVLLGVIDRRSGNDSVLLKPGDVSAVTVRVFLAGTQVGSDITPDPADVIFDPPVTGTVWAEAAAGWNFGVPVPHTYLAASGSYKFQVDVVLVSGDRCHCVYRQQFQKLPADG